MTIERFIWAWASNCNFGRILLVTIDRIGIWLVVGGMIAVGLGFFLGAGPCNATTAGMIAMLLGYVAVPVGLIVIAVAYVFRSRGSQ